MKFKSGMGFWRDYFETHKECREFLEIWEKVPDWPYEVSTKGRVRRSEVDVGNKSYIGRILTPVLKHSGYLNVTLHKAKRVEFGDKRSCSSDKKQFAVHRLVCWVFLRKITDQKIETNHIDGDKTNNNIENLELVTHQKNMEHAKSIGLSNWEGERNGRHKLIESEVTEIRKLSSEGMSWNDIAAKFSISYYGVKHVVMRTRWDHVKDGYYHNISPKFKKLTERKVMEIRNIYNKQKRDKKIELKLALQYSCSVDAIKQDSDNLYSLFWYLSDDRLEDVKSSTRVLPMPTYLQQVDQFKQPSNKRWLELELREVFDALYQARGETRNIYISKMIKEYDPIDLLNSARKEFQEKGNQDRMLLIVNLLRELKEASLTAIQTIVDSTSDDVEYFIELIVELAEEHEIARQMLKHLTKHPSKDVRLRLLSAARYLPPCMREKILKILSNDPDTTIKIEAMELIDELN